MAELHFLERAPNARADADAVLAALAANRQPSTEPQALRRICTSLQAYKRRDLLFDLFTELENSTGDIKAARAFVAQFTSCGFNFDEILLDDWYNKPLSRSSLLDPLQRDAASALSTEGDSHGSGLLRIAESAQMGEKVPFSEFNTVACTGTQDAALWDKCTTLFTDHTLKDELVKCFGSQKNYDEREKVFVEYLLLAICYKYVIYPGYDLDESTMVHSLVLAQLRLIARLFKCAVERWDDECPLSRSMHTLQGDVLIGGCPDLAFKSVPDQDKAEIAATKAMIEEFSEEVRKADETNEEPQNAGPLPKKRRLELVTHTPTKKERINRLHSAQDYLSALYLPTVDFPIEVTIPALNHKTPGVKKTPSFLTSASKQQLGCQLLCMQKTRGFDEPICGLLTDGCSGTVVLLRSKTNKTDSHRFIRLPAASSPQELFLYCSLICYYSAQELEEMMLKKWREESKDEGEEGSDSAVSAGEQEELEHQSAHRGGDGSDGFSAARQSEGVPRDGDMSDVSSEPGEDDDSVSVNSSVFHTEEGFDSEAEFEYYNNPRRALRKLRERLAQGAYQR